MQRVVCSNLPSSNTVMFLMISDGHFCPGSLVLSDQMMLSKWTSRRLFACVANFGFDRVLAASSSGLSEDVILSFAQNHHVVVTC